MKNPILNYIIWRYQWDTKSLVNSYPPHLYNTNKKIVYQIACPPDSIANGKLTFSRWQKFSLPSICSHHKTVIEPITGYFDYKQSNNNQIEWYLNFAASDLFYAYSGSLFAQDEMQVAEHPALASLREGLLDKNINMFTVEKGEPTPILISGVERRCAISTDINSAEDRPFGLYGNNFSEGSPTAIKKATKPLNPPTISHIIAMEAPSYGHGTYTKEQIEYILTTAFTGFFAARIETKLQIKQPKNVIIHTGFWGCGAYGGNRVLMTILQILAAYLSQINCLVFHTGDVGGMADFTTAQKIITEDLGFDNSPVEISVLINKLVAKEFLWGVSDGN
jgi:Poly (ADP-ribose) glycohydrolase (PARG)